MAERIVRRLPFVRMLGFLPRETLAALYASADVCVLPSHTETCGLVALAPAGNGLAEIFQLAPAGYHTGSHAGGSKIFELSPQDVRHLRGLTWIRPQRFQVEKREDHD